MILWNRDIFWDYYHTVKISYRYNASVVDLFLVRFVFMTVWTAQPHGIWSGFAPKSDTGLMFCSATSLYVDIHHNFAGSD